MLDIGEVFAGFTVERVLGQGGMGTVYLARHPRLDRLTALKLLNRDLFADARIRARFEREADLAAGLDHPGIVTVFDRGAEGEQLWISMQYVDGVDAATVDPMTLPPERAVQIVEGVADALDYAHGRGVLHRDVKPANILLARSSGGQGERVFLTDFGIARLRADSTHLTQQGMFTATLAYASPEQMTGAELDHRSDQYSLACSLYWLLTGIAPFDSPDPNEIIRGTLHLNPPPLALRRQGLPPALDAVLAAAMAKHPAARFDSCTAFTKAARQALTTNTPPVLPRPVPNPPAYYAPTYPPAPGYPAGPPAPRQAAPQAPWHPPQVPPAAPVPTYPPPAPYPGGPQQPVAAQPPSAPPAGGRPGPQSAAALPPSAPPAGVQPGPQPPVPQSPSAQPGGVEPGPQVPAAQPPAAAQQPPSTAEPAAVQSPVVPSSASQRAGAGDAPDAAQRTADGPVSGRAADRDVVVGESDPGRASGTGLESGRLPHAAAAGAVGAGDREISARRGAFIGEGGDVSDSAATDVVPMPDSGQLDVDNASAVTEVTAIAGASPPGGAVLGAEDAVENGQSAAPAPEPALAQADSPIATTDGASESAAPARADSAPAHEDRREDGDAAGSEDDAVPATPSESSSPLLNLDFDPGGSAEENADAGLSQPASVDSAVEVAPPPAGDRPPAGMPRPAGAPQSAGASQPGAAQQEGAASQSARAPQAGAAPQASAGAPQARAAQQAEVASWPAGAPQVKAAQQAGAASQVATGVPQVGPDQSARAPQAGAAQQASVGASQVGAAQQAGAVPQPPVPHPGMVPSGPRMPPPGVGHRPWAAPKRKVSWGISRLQRLGWLVLAALVVALVTLLVALIVVVLPDGDEDEAAAEGASKGPSSSAVTVGDSFVPSRRVFPTLVPQGAVAEGMGYRGARCAAVRGVSELEWKEPALQWNPISAGWQCERTDNNPGSVSYLVLEYPTAAQARSVVEALPSAVRYPGDKDGVPFSLRRWVVPDQASSRMQTAHQVVSFPDDATRAKYLIAVSRRGSSGQGGAPRPTAQDEVIAWWDDVPL
ncbi:protein kinase [Nocardia asteroides]|uniref:serine/threonine-protein kinase n=1 Tax=Nocardia asteroides TaxID=1824 RepID=UPI00343ADCE9